MLVVQEQEFMGSSDCAFVGGGTYPIIVQSKCVCDGGSGY